MHRIDDDLTWQLALGATQVVLRQEGGKYLTRRQLDRDPGKVVATAQHPTLTHHDHMHAGAARHHRRGHHVHIAMLCIHALLVLDPPQLTDLVAQLRSALELQLLCGSFHGPCQLIGQGTAATFQEHYRMADILGVLLLADKAHTGSLAALDLILQTGAQAIAEVAVFALTDLEGLLQQSETLPYRTGTGIGAEIAPPGLFRTAVQPQPWIGILTGEVDIGMDLSSRSRMLYGGRDTLIRLCSSSRASVSLAVIVVSICPIRATSAAVFGLSPVLRK